MNFREACKLEMVEWAKKRSKQIAIEKTAELAEAMKQVEELSKEIQMLPNCPNICARLEKATRKVESMVQEKSQSAAFRSKCKFVKENETNSAYFFALEKHHYNQKTMSVLKNNRANCLLIQKKYYVNKNSFMRHCIRKTKRLTSNFQMKKILP